MFCLFAFIYKIVIPSAHNKCSELRLKMDISRVPNEKKLELCRRYFKVGFLLLPFVWIINTFWFFDEAFRKPAYDEQKAIRKYVIFSAIGSLVWIVVIAIWMTIFQLYRADWGEFADDISFIIPLGRA